MKKILFLLLIMLFTFGIVACDQNALNSLTTSPIVTSDDTEVSTSVNTNNTNKDTTSNELTTEVSTDDITTDITTEENHESYTISFNEMGGSTVEDLKVYEGETITLPTSTKDGYSFLGWFYEDEQEFLESTQIISNLTLFAKWEEVGSYYDDYVDLSLVHTMNDGTDLEVSGVVYYMTQNGYYIQDDTANLFVFTDKDSPNVELGDRVVVSGELTTYREVKQIKTPILKEINSYENEIYQEPLDFTYNKTDLEPGKIYSITGEVVVEGKYNTVFLYDGSTKIAELYYKSLSKSIAALETYVGDTVTVELLFYAIGDDVERYAFQGSTSHIKVVELDDSEALIRDTNSLPINKTLSSDYDFGKGNYGSLYEIIGISGDASDYIAYDGAVLNVTRPLEEIGDVTGTLSIRISLNDEVPMIKTINIIVKAIGSSSSNLPYYDSSQGLVGTDLFNELNRIINNGFKQLSYDDAKWVLEESDRDPNNSNNVILVYTRDSVKGEWDYPIWNREHTWPQSKLTASGQKADMHNLKPADVQENSRRGNLPFGYMTGTGVYEPHDDVKGDVARIIFYMATMYTNLNISVVGDLDILMDWHLTDPVDDFERNRNEVIYSYQKNRNPYIDNPNYVELIWGNVG
ncbi:MAG: endonuclease [Candidatus Izemoplasmatales bacterium]